MPSLPRIGNNCCEFQNRENRFLYLYGHHSHLLNRNLFSCSDVRQYVNPSSISMTRIVSVLSILFSHCPSRGEADLREVIAHRATEKIGRAAVRTTYAVKEEETIRKQRKIAEGRKA